MKTVDTILFTICLLVAGCAFNRKCDITLTNMQYTGVYCPGGCTATVHYNATTNGSLF